MDYMKLDFPVQERPLNLITHPLTCPWAVGSLLWWQILSKIYCITMRLECRLSASLSYQKTCVFYDFILGWLLLYGWVEPCMLVVRLKTLKPEQNTEMEMLSFWWNFHHWLHWKLSFWWQLPVQPVIKKIIKMTTFWFQWMTDIWQTIFSNAFSLMKNLNVWMKFHLDMLIRV